MYNVRDLGKGLFSLVTTQTNRGRDMMNEIDFSKLEWCNEEEFVIKRCGSHFVVELNVDIIVPAALPDVINTTNVERVKAKMVVEAANLPVRPEIEKVLANRGVMVVPDILANAGGVISSYAEYRGYNPKRMLELVQRKIRQNTVKVIETALDNDIAIRDAAMNIAKERIAKANRR